MGTWNETCFLSHLPIEEGEVVGAILIAKVAEEPKRTSYPNELWQPITPVIMGTYDGYGKMEVFAENSNGEPANTDILKDAWQFAFSAGGDTPGKEQLEQLIAAASMDILSVSYDEWTPSWRPKQQKVSVVFIKSAMLDFVNEVTEDVGVQYRKVVGKFLHSTGVFTRVHPMLKHLHSQAVSVESVLRIENWLSETRGQWGPTSGCGSQRGVEYPETVRFYELIASMAQDAYTDYEFSEQGRETSQNSFTAFLYEDDGETAADFQTFTTMPEAIACAKEQNWHEVVNDLTGAVVWRSPKMSENGQEDN